MQSLPARVAHQEQPVSPGLRGSALPVRAHHLPADRAPHRRWNEPLALLALRVDAGDVLRGLAGAGGGTRPGARRLGDGLHRARRPRVPGDGDAAVPAAARPGPDHPPDRAAVSLGLQRTGSGGLGERSARLRRRSQRSHPGVEGADRHHPARPAGARAQGRRARLPRAAGAGDAARHRRRKPFTPQPLQHDPAKESR